MEARFIDRPDVVMTAGEHERIRCDYDSRSSEQTRCDNDSRFYIQTDQMIAGVMARPDVMITPGFMDRAYAEVTTGLMDFGGAHRPTGRARSIPIQTCTEEHRTQHVGLTSLLRPQSCLDHALDMSDFNPYMDICICDPYGAHFLKRSLLFKKTAC